MSLNKKKSITTALIKLPPQYATLFDHYETTVQKETLYLYRARKDNDVDAPLHVSIFDYELCEHQLEEFSLEPMKKVVAHGVYQMTNEGALFIGYGPTPYLAQAFAYYQILRNDFWLSPFDFLPTVSFSECALLENDDCIPTALMTEDLYEDEQYFIEDVFCVEYAPNQWKYAHSFELALEELSPHIPSSWKLH